MNHLVSLYRHATFIVQVQYLFSKANLHIGQPPPQQEHKEAQSSTKEEIGELTEKLANLQVVKDTSLSDTVPLATVSRPPPVEKSTGLVFDPKMTLHQGSVNHPEQPARLQRIWQQLDTGGLIQLCKYETIFIGEFDVHLCCVNNNNNFTSSCISYLEYST